MKAAKNDNKKTLKVAKGCSPSPCAPRVKKSRRIYRKSHKITGEGEHVLAGKDKCYDSFHSTDELHVEVLHKDENIRMGLEKDGYHPYLVTHCLLPRPFLIFIGCLGIAIVYVGFLGYVCCLVFLSAFEGIGSLLATSFVLYFRNSFEGIGMVLTLELEIKDKSRFGKILALTIGSISVIYGRYEYLRGKILDILPDYCKEAEDHLSKAVKLNPSLIDAWLCLCNCIWKKGDFSAAKNCFIHALRKGPNRKILFQLSMLVRKMAQGVTGILRSNGYSLVATFLDYQLIGYNEDSSLLTVFALLDIAMINTDLNQGLYNGYVGDIWSLGVSILELCLGRFPFSVGRQGNWASLMCAIYLILYECESHNLILGMRHKLKHTHFQYACHQGMIH